MELNKLLKATMVALPILALSACSSSPESSTDSTGSLSGSEQSQDANSGVETGSAAQVLTPQEQAQQALDDLRHENIVYFEFDRSQISPDYEKVLQAHAEYLIDNPGANVVIEGHTDPRGTPEYNIALGERRANSVKQYLQGLGVLPSQMSVVSYGEEKLADTERSDIAYAKDRRAVLAY